MIIAIDPGTTQSAWLTLGGNGSPVDFGILPNDDLLAKLRGYRENLLTAPSTVVIEKIESMGMAVGAEVFETVFWSGRFAEAARPVPIERIPRRAVKMHLCGTNRAKDANVRQALMDRYGGESAKGTKRAPGPLYGVSKDVWAALGVAVTWHDRWVALLPD